MNKISNFNFSEDFNILEANSVTLDKDVSGQFGLIRFNGRQLKVSITQTNNNNNKFSEAQLTGVVVKIAIMLHKKELLKQSNPLDVVIDHEGIGQRNSGIIDLHENCLDAKNTRQDYNQLIALLKNPSLQFPQNSETRELIDSKPREKFDINEDNNSNIMPQHREEFKNNLPLVQSFSKISIKEKKNIDPSQISQCFSNIYKPNIRTLFNTPSPDIDSKLFYSYYPQKQDLNPNKTIKIVEIDDKGNELIPFKPFSSQLNNYQSSPHSLSRFDLLKFSKYYSINKKQFESKILSEENTSLVDEILSNKEEGNSNRFSSLTLPRKTDKSKVHFQNGASPKSKNFTFNPEINGMDRNPYPFSTEFNKTTQEYISFKKNNPLLPSLNIFGGSKGYKVGPCHNSNIISSAPTPEALDQPQTAKIPSVSKNSFSNRFSEKLGDGTISFAS